MDGVKGAKKRNQCTTQNSMKYLNFQRTQIKREGRFKKEIILIRLSAKWDEAGVISTRKGKNKYVPQTEQSSSGRRNSSSGFFIKIVDFQCFLNHFLSPCWLTLCYNRCHTQFLAFSLKLKQQILVSFLLVLSFPASLPKRISCISASIFFTSPSLSLFNLKQVGLFPHQSPTHIEENLPNWNGFSLETHLAGPCRIVDLMHTLLQLSPLLGIWFPCYLSGNPSHLPLVPGGFVQLYILVFCYFVYFTQRSDIINFNLIILYALLWA